MQMQRLLLITVTATILYYSCLVDGMPLSWSKSVRHRRSKTESSATEPPTLSSDSGRVEQSSLDVNPPAGGATNSSANETISESLNETFIERCMRECYDSSLPRKSIQRLKKEIGFSPHPSFYLSEWLENEHRMRFCMRTVPDNEGKPFCEDMQELIEKEESERLINETLAAFTPIEDQKCILNYEITYKNHTQNIYPRYLFQVQCKNQVDRIIKGMKSLRLHQSGDQWVIFEQDVSVGCQ